MPQEQILMDSYATNNTRLCVLYTKEEDVAIKLTQFSTHGHVLQTHSSQGGVCPHPLQPPDVMAP